MKTITKIMALMLLSCAMLFDLPTQAQDFPYPGDNSPIYSGMTVDCGNLEGSDQKTQPIWFKVSGKIAQPTQHNKLHDPANPAKAGSKVQAGNYVDVNFNVNKNIDNRYTLVSYKIDQNGLRTIFDYQSNLYNSQLTSPPVQGNSNQQLVLIPTNCPWEVYWVKGCVIKSFTAGSAGTAQNLTFGADGNPYGYNGGIGGTPKPVNSGTLANDNLVLGYTFGDGLDVANCDVCPVVLPNGTTCVTPQLIEVINIPNATATTDDDDKELIFSVINNINTVDNACSPMITKNNQSALQWPEIGDILFLNINPTHTGNNQPYAFRYNYQLGPKIAGYTLPPTTPAQPLSPPAPPYQGAFVFDQRNNHNVLDYDIYQSEIVRYTISGAEWDRLNTKPFNDAKPQICIELSPKHPEPHTSLEPVYCFELAFDCEPTCPDPDIEDVCFVETCDYRIDLAAVQGVLDPITGSFTDYQPVFLVTNKTGQNITSVTFSTTGTTATATADGFYDDDNDPTTNPPFITPIFSKFLPSALRSMSK